MVDTSISRGALGANTYMLPTVQPQAPTPQAQPYDDGIRALEGLQYVKGQTEAYYKKIADLKSFMQGAHANLGIDVRVPDASRPESVKLHQIYNDALVDIMHTGNLLKQSNSIDMLNRNQGNIYNPEIDPTSVAAAQLIPQQDVWSKGFEPTIVEVNNKLQMPSQTLEEQTQKEKIYNDTVAEYKRLSDLYPERKAYYDYQISGLTPPTKGDFRPFAPQRQSWQEQAWGKKVETAGNILKKTVNLISGAHDSYQPDPTDLTPKGIPYLKSYEFAGKKIGNSEIAYMRLNPVKEGGKYQVDFVLKDQNIVDASSQDGLNLASALGGATPDAVMEYAMKNDVTDNFDQVDKSKLLGKDYDKILKKHEKAAAKTLEIREKTEAVIDGALSKLTRTGASSRTVLDLPKARTKVTIERGFPSGKYYIKDFKSSFLRPKDKKDRTANQEYNNLVNKFDYENGEGATLDEIKEFLFKKSLPEVYGGSSTAPSTQQQVQPAQSGTKIDDTSAQTGGAY